MRRHPVLLLCALFVAMVGSIATPRTNVTAEPDASSGDNVPPSSTTAPYNHESRVDDIEGVVDNLALLISSLSDAFGERYGGIWIDRERQPSVYAVGVVAPTQRDRDLFSVLTRGSDRFRIAPAKYSEDELEAFKEVINSLHEAHRSMTGASVYDPGNVVAVDVNDNPDPLLAADIIAHGVPFDAFVIRPGASQAEPAHATRTSYPPMEAGLNVTVAGTCTSSFVGRDDDSGNYYGTTAGHCGAPGTRVNIGATYISNIGVNSYYNSNPSNSGAARFYIPVSSVTGRINTGPNAHRANRSPAYQTADLDLGTRLCFQGATSLNHNCGNINVRDSPTTDRNGHQHRHLWCINFPSARGDSGGPVYHVNGDGTAKGAGLIHGSAAVGGVPSACFSSLRTAMWDLSQMSIKYGL